MAGLMTLGLLAALAVIVWSANVVGVAGKAGRVAQWLFWMVAVLLSAAACWATFFVRHYWDANTRAHGWPVPHVVFQREDAASPWRDYVGWATVLSVPINIILFLFVPAAVFLVLAWLKSRQLGRISIPGNQG